MVPIALPYYTSHKTVQAGQIVEIRPLQTALVGQPVITDLVVCFPAAEVNGPDATIIRVSAEYVGKHKPRVGGYYVKYADGYESWSPASVFEDGYKLAPRNFLDRLFIEQAELSDKLRKLGEFIKENDTFKTLPENDRALLVQQEQFMAGYNTTLLARIALVVPAVNNDSEPSSPPTSAGEPNQHEDA